MVLWIRNCSTEIHGIFEMHCQRPANEVVPTSFSSNICESVQGLGIGKDSITGWNSSVKKLSFLHLYNVYKENLSEWDFQR
jgi:hypothetical protein